MARAEDRLVLLELHLTLAEDLFSPPLTPSFRVITSDFFPFFPFPKIFAKWMLYPLPPHNSSNNYYGIVKSIKNRYYYHHIRNGWSSNRDGSLQSSINLLSTNWNYLLSKAFHLGKSWGFYYNTFSYKCETISINL